MFFGVLVGAIEDEVAPPPTTAAGLIGDSNSWLASMQHSLVLKA